MSSGLRKLLLVIVPLLMAGAFMLARTNIDSIAAGDASQNIMKIVEVPGPKVISVEGLESLIKLEEKLVIIDARSEKDYNASHIDNARNLPSSKATSDKLAALIPAKDTPVVLYCTNPTCPAALKLADIAAANGYSNLHYFKDGIEGWQSKDAAITFGASQKG